MRYGLVVRLTIDPSATIQRLLLEVKLYSTVMAVLENLPFIQDNASSGLSSEQRKVALFIKPLK